MSPAAWCRKPRAATRRKLRIEFQGKQREMLESVFTLDLDETFPRLSRAPIVEAVIHWQAQAQKPLELESLKKVLAERLPQYPHSSPIQRFGLKATLSPAEGTS